MQVRWLAGVLIGCVPFAWGDFHYTKRTRISGGAMGGMTRMFGKLAGAPTDAESTVSLQGHRLREEWPGRVQIIDLDKQQYITIDTKHRTYTVMTFAEMRAAMEQASAVLAQQAKPPQGLPMFAISVEEGQGRQTIAGHSCSDVALKLEMQAQEAKSQPGGLTTTMHMCMARDVAGADELRAFYRSLAEKLGTLPGQGGMAMNPQLVAAQRALATKAASLQGFPLQTVMDMGAPVATAPPETAAPAPAASGRDEAIPTSPSELVTQNLGKMFGGFGRKKKSKPEPAASQPARPAPPGTLMEITTEVTSIATSPVEASLFQVPVGYTETVAPEHP